MSAARQPVFDAMTLDAIAAAFHQRGKAIRYHGEFTIARDIDAGDERLNIEYCCTLGLSLRLSVWGTGEWWFHACQHRPGKNNGWLFKHELRGEAIRLPPDVMVKAFEDSMRLAYWPEPEQLQKLKSAWHLPRPAAEA